MEHEVLPRINEPQHLSQIDPFQRRNEIMDVLLDRARRAELFPYAHNSRTLTTLS